MGSAAASSSRLPVGALDGFKRAGGSDLDASRIALASSLASPVLRDATGIPQRENAGGTKGGMKGGEVAEKAPGERNSVKKADGAKNADIALRKKFVDAVKIGDISSVRLMLTSDPDLCCSSMPRDTLAYTPLHWASKKNQTEMCELLLNARAHIDSRNREGVTPLHSAAINGCDAVVQMLLERGADSLATDASGRSAEACARSRNFDSCTRLFEMHSKVRDMTSNPAAWTKANMRGLLKLCGSNHDSAGSTCKSRHELEKRVRLAVPALANVWQVRSDTLLDLAVSRHVLKKLTKRESSCVRAGRAPPPKVQPRERVCHLEAKPQATATASAHLGTHTGARPVPEGVPGL
jgi:hypothetical protein